MCLCNPAVKQPVAALMQPTVSAYLTDTLYNPSTHPALGRAPATNRNEPDSPKILFSGPIQIYQHRFELSIYPKAVDGFSRQHPALTDLQYLASRANPYRFCKLASSVRMDVQYLASSVQIRTRANFSTGSLGTHPKPRNRTLCELRVFAKRFL